MSCTKTLDCDPIHTHPLLAPVMATTALLRVATQVPVCVAFGDEVDGLRPELLEIADTHVRIPMLGKENSLNVATTAGGLRD